MWFNNGTKYALIIFSRAQKHFQRLLSSSKVEGAIGLMDCKTSNRVTWKNEVGRSVHL